jgi:hypothetical protein
MPARAKGASHRLAGEVVIDDTPNHRLITIDGEVFPYYTQGDLVCTPAKMNTGAEADRGVVLAVPILCDSVRWVGQEDEA